MKISKVFSIVICICLILSAFSNIVSADSQLEIGDYIQMGTYEDSPIIWRYVADDDNGKLIVSDKILCEKTFSPRDGYWKESYIREWLNSNEILYREYKGETYTPYGDELGFLSNFAQGELSLIKYTTQWTMVSDSSLSENGVTDVFYDPVKKHFKVRGAFRFDPEEYYSIEDIPNIYYGAAAQTTDQMFLLDDLQIYNMYKNLGTVSATLRNSEENEYYFLRSSNRGVKGTGRGITTVSKYDDSQLDIIGESLDFGIRPAFYLNETAVSGMTGSGTAEDPYILIPSAETGDEAVATNEISVEVNGEAVAFDVAPVIESDRVLVPMRAIFEKLGATVEWEGETETVTATKDNTVITLQIDNNVMTKNGEEIILDVSARLVGDRTLVPIRAVAEGLDATVDWIDEENKVVITK